MNGKFKALDLCCKAGGVSTGLHLAGFDVTGVDIEPQKHYPFRFIQADALTFDFAGYDLVCVSPPCQEHCLLNYVNKRSYADLIPEMRRRLKASGVPYVMENIRRRVLQDPIMLCGQMFGLKVFRHRFFESNMPLVAPAHEKHDGATGTHRWPYKPVNGYVQVTGQGSNFTLESGSRAMGIDWMNKAELAQAIPPAYAEYIGRQVFKYLEAKQELAA